ncbi:MAG: hypothetical protein J6Y94_00655, partial [Bacteriovoracaceae bacterium]|nr:hypothetical protein [Bacteriovoracaceae bacterium]
SRRGAQYSGALLFTADWCIYCKWAERVLTSRGFKRFKQDYNLMVVKIDLTSYDGKLMEWSVEHGSDGGLPSFFLQLPARPPEFLNENISVERLRQRLAAAEGPSEES